MASGNIRGITIELGGDTTGLEQALNRVNTESKSLQSELKAVERGLKFDPGNVELVRQRQELLTQSISDTSQRLDILRNAQAQVQRQYDAGEIPVEQYRAFQRELQTTEGNLNRLQNSLNAIDGEQERLGQSTRALGTLFEATGTNVNDFASTLGSRLTRAIRDGSASADQLDRAIRIVGQNSLGASTDVDQLRRALRQIDDGGSIQEVRRELSQIANEADQAGDAVNGFGDKLSQVAGGLAAGGGIASIISQALDVSTLDTKIDITLDVPQESRDAVRDAVLGLQAYGLEGEEALEGVRRQFVLNREATDEANAATVRYAGAIANAYSDIDFKELIQESNEISTIFGITADEALGLVNNLLRVGFPPDQLDIISEYGDQLIRAGYSAEEIQGIFAAGVDTGTYNIDQLLDGLKEGRIRLAEFGQGLDKATKQAIDGSGIGFEQLQKYGEAVAAGGEAGTKAFRDAAIAVSQIDDAVKRNEVGVTLFGTLYEEQGDKILETIINADSAIVGLDENQRALNQTVDGLDSSPAVLLSTAMTDLQTALKPVLDFVAVLIAGIASFASENIALVATITAVGTVLGILAGAFVLIAPAIGGLVTALPVLTTAFAAISAPIVIVVAAITALGAAFVTLYAQSEEFRNGVNAVFESIKTVATQVFQAIASFIGERIKQILAFWQSDGQQILQAAQNIFNGIKAVIDFVMPAIQLVISVAWTAIKNIISGSLDVILGLVKTFSGIFTGDFSKVWEGVKQIFTGAINLILGLMSVTFFGGIRSAAVNITKSLTSTFKTGLTSLTNTFKSSFTAITGSVSNFRTTIVNQFNAIKTSIVNTVKSIDLRQIGVDIIRGLANGIASAKDFAIDAVKASVGSIVDTAKNLLKIKSPSRVFMEIGDFVGQGMAKGIDGTQDLNKQAIADLNKIINEEAIKNGKEVSGIAKKAEEERTKVQNEAAKKRNNLKKATSKQILDIEKDMNEKLKEINDKAQKDISEKSLVVNKNTLDAIRAFIQSKKELNDISLIQEAEYYRLAYRAAATNSEANKALLKDYQSTVESINNAVTTVNNDFLNRTKTINDNLIKAEEDLNKKYADTLNARYNTLVSSYGLFEAVATQELVNPQELIANLSSQVDALQAFSDNIQALKNKGISTTLLDDLRELGPKSNAQLVALNSLTDAELNEYQKLYEKRSREARKAAIKELEPLRKDTQTQIQNLRTTANSELALLNTEWQAAITRVVGGTEEKLKTLNQVGKNAGLGLLNGLSSVQPALQSKAQEIADSISKTISSALKIKSPSRVMMGFGENIGQGLVIGIDDTIASVSQASERLANAVQGAQLSLSGSANRSANGVSSSSTVTSTTNNNTPINITLNYSGNASRNETIGMVDIIERELSNRFNNNLRLQGSKV